MAPRFPCLACNRIVGNNHEALQCDGCARWQHRVCGTNFTKEQYLELTRAEYFVWYCSGCAPQFLNLSVPTDTEINLDVAPASPQPTDTEMDVDIASASPQPSTPRPSPAAAQESSFVVPVEEEEPSLLDEPVQAVAMVPAELTFEVIPRATARGCPLLVDSDGYAYGIHRERRGVTHWRCTRRGKDFKCQAMVRQEGDVFSHGIHEHAHASDTGTATKAILVRDVKEQALVNPFQSAYTIAECLVTQVDRAPNQRPVDYLGRIGNRRRQQGRPKHPTDLEFDLAMDHVPAEFEMADITVGTRRHLLFFTQHQLDLLKTAHRWFVDAAFKVVKAPYTQLWSVHTFARVDNKTTQLPLAFALMSGKRRRDYQAVLRALKGELRRLHGEDAFFSLEAALADFEAAVWQAFRQEFPGVELRGCSFHWGQAVFRKELGMQQGFNTDPALHHYCKQLLALPYLPWEKVDPTLQELEAEATIEAQRHLCAYVRHTWLDNTLWHPSSWSAFYRFVRTNNDVEGWHRRLNSKAARGQLNLYLLLQLLSGEAALVSVNLTLLRESAAEKSSKERHREAVQALGPAHRQGKDSQTDPACCQQTAAIVVINLCVCMCVFFFTV
ncbi:hypothetical protein ACOMHN_053027 [Nucella lapillus]